MIRKLSFRGLLLGLVAKIPSLVWLRLPRTGLYRHHNNCNNAFDVGNGYEVS